MIKLVLFDLDGTLLPMEQEKFVKAYFGSIAMRMSSYGYDPDELIKTIWLSTGAMIKNDGSKSNEEVFWDSFAKTYGQKSLADKIQFDNFYIEQFDDLKATCGYNPKACETIHKIKESGLRVALATNPIFPPIATQKRVKWTGLSPQDFEYITTYDNSSFCKPNLSYYEELLEKLDVKPQECLMVGNDVNEDMVAKELDMSVFLLDDCLINKDLKDISDIPKGSFDDLLKYLKIYK